MESIWLNSYPPGIPAEVDVFEFTSLRNMLQRSCQRFGDLPAYSNMGVSITYAQLDRLSRDFAGYLQKSLGLRQGERVALMMPNLLQYPVALFGVLRAGLVVVNINPQYTAAELEHQLKDSGAVAIVVLENFAHTLQQVLDKNPTLTPTVITTEVGDMFAPVKKLLTNVVVKHIKHMVPPWTIGGSTPFNAALRAGRQQNLEEVPLCQTDLAFLQYTGGTTGVAKGAALTHGNLVANVQQMTAWMARDLVEGKEVFVCPLPLYHVYALTSNLVFMKLGARTVLVTNPRDMRAYIQDLKRYPFTIIIGVNTLYRALLDTPGFAGVDTSALKVTSAGGMAVQSVVAERWKKRTGVNIIEGYGMTETSPIVIANPLDTEAWTGTIGIPIPSTQAVILDEAGKQLATGEVGEICVRGPQVMPGYWNCPDETSKVFTAEGWLRTGDMGFVDDRGYFRITDRKKDMIIVSGFKVFPNQIEDVVALHPGVAEVVAIGVQDDRSGEVVKIVVVKSDPALNEQLLLAHCRQHLTSYKMPRIIEFRSEPLPKTNLGKFLRRELRDAAAGASVP
ncbi:AMP-binding protein [Rhodoferax sp. U11-2br]|uniref:AMP-binding protein n=1 Tax=Rhodoferax sp. U11-2br TaxID=2838878 RepID=UPI001BE75600|nr:AMP-binding protein [Rhodoferax sp. U11-2br]MBT3068823.1 AMP-binding protein [Rhodoferax sp. U11-2br]